MNYLHVAGNIIPVFEEAIEMLKVGDKKAVMVPPEKGYCDFNSKLFLKVDRANFPEDMDINLCMKFSS